MNLQEAYNKVAEHLLTQRARCGDLDPDGKVKACYYRKDGMKCAIGALIPDNVEINKYLNCSSVEQLVLEKEEVRDLVEDIPLYFLEKLQMIHDEKPVEKWAWYLLKFAEENNLQVPHCVLKEAV